MENYNIENAKTRFFESKEDYLKFRQAWKDFHNDGKVVWREDVEQYSWALGKQITIRNVKFTSLSAEHYLLYNLLREYGVRYGFTEHGENGWEACEYATREVYYAAKALKDVNDKSNFTRERSRKLVEKMLLPFNGTVSHQALAEVGEWININIYNNQNWPQFEIEEWREPEVEPKKQSLKDKLSAWRATA